VMECHELRKTSLEYEKDMKNILRGCTVHTSGSKEQLANPDLSDQKLYNAVCSVLCNIQSKIVQDYTTT